MKKPSPVSLIAHEHLQYSDDEQEDYTDCDDNYD